MKLTEIQIENGIFELIRLKIVELGYLPDVTAYLPDNPANQALYKAAIEAIKTGGKEIITIQNDGSYKGRGEIEENVFLVSKEDRDPSRTGTKATPKYTYQPLDTNYKKDITTDGLFDLQYRITIICYNSVYLGIMEDILMQTLGFRKRINAIDEAAIVTGEFWIWIGSYISLDSGKWMERAQMYNVPSVDLIGDTDDGVVARAEEITIGVSTDPENSDPDNPDDIDRQT